MKRMFYIIIPVLCLVSDLSAREKADKDHSSATERSQDGVEDTTTQKVMVVNSMQIIQGSKRGREVAARIEEKEKKAQEHIMALGKQLEEKRRDFEGKRVAMSEKAIREEERKLARMQRDIENQAQDLKSELQESISMAMNELAYELREIVAKEAKKQGWSRVDDATTGQVLYVASAGDVTQDVITLWDQAVVQVNETPKKTKTALA